jgi:peptidylprolyl isomerase
VSNRPRRSGVLLAAPVAVLASVALVACGSSSSPSTASGAPTTHSSAAASTAPGGPVAGADTKVGIKVSAAFGKTPTLSIPGGPAPKTLTAQVLTAGHGATVTKGELLIANYVGQTWAPKKGKPNVFDSSFARGAPAAFVIGEGQVIPGWDKSLVGKQLGSRVLLTIPPADGYGESGQPNANISGTDTLVFVVDLVGAYPPGASAPGTAVSTIPAGWPKISNVPGKAPKILSTAGVKAPSQPKSVLVVKGSGATIDPNKTLVLEAVEADLATGKDSQSTWAQVPQAASAQNVLGIARALTGQKVGSRAIILLPATPAVAATATTAAQPAQPPEVLIADVVGQF